MQHDHRALLGKPQSKRPLERPRHKWEDNIKTHPRDAGTVGIHRIYHIKDTVINLRVS
jgi:hypothetical protein